MSREELDDAPGSEGEERLRENERRLATLLSNLPGMAYRCKNDSDWTMEIVSDGCEALTGYRATDLVGVGARPYLSLIHIDDQKRIWNETQEALRRRLPFRLTYRIIASDGREKWVWEQGVGVYNGSELEALEGFITDITERKRAETTIQQANESLAASLVQYRRLFNSISDAVCVYELRQDGLPSPKSYLEINDSACRLLGYTREELLQLGVTDIIVPEERAAGPVHARKLLEVGHVIWSGSVVTKSGQCVPVEVNTHIFDLDDSLLAISSLRDITERIEAEKQFQDIFNGALEGIYRTSFERKFLAANSALAGMLGYESAHELISTISDTTQQVWLDPIERSRFSKLLEDQKVVRGFECQFKRKDGTPFWVSLNSRIVSDADGQALSIEGFVEDITERKRILDALRKSEEKFAKAFRCSPAVTILAKIVNGDDQIMDVNAAFELLSGYRAEEAVGRSTKDLGLWTDPREFDEYVTRLRATGKTGPFEMHFRGRNGVVGTALVSAELIELDGSPCVISESIDITQRKQAEARLQAQSERFQTIIENTEAGYFRIGLDGRYEDVNPAWLQMHGFERKDEAIGLHVSKVQIPGDLTKALAISEALLRGESVKSGEFSRLRRDGTIGYHRFSANPVLDGDRVIGIEGFLLDTSARKTAELQRRQSDKLYRALFDSMHEGVALHKLVGSNGIYENYILLEVNQRYEQILGITRQKVVNKLATDVYGTQDAPYLKEYSSVVETGTPLVFESTFPVMNKHFVISVAPMGGDLFATIFFDVTEQKQTESELRSLATAIEHAEEQIVVTDLHGRIRYCNPAFEKVSGYTKAEALGQNPRFLKSGKHSAQFYGELWTTLNSGHVWRGHLTNKKKDGTLYEEEATLSPITDVSGRRTGFVAVKRDVTAQLELERQYFQSQKLESVGRLAGGVAHDFNNLLTVINGYSDFIINQLSAPDPIRSFAEQIRKAGERGASLTEQLLAFSHKNLIEPMALDLNKTIRDAVPLLQRLIGEDITLTVGLDGCVGYVLADPGQIGQVIMNLAVNARDAMPKGGKLGIQTTTREFGEDISAVFPDATPGPYILLTVTDTGHGMDDAIRQRVFEPFFTTKAVGKGTGLGLSTVYGILRQHGGWIDVSSEVGVGTSFKAYLPRIEARPQPAAKATGALATEGVETILVVEDQQDVRLLTKAVLNQYGYQVIEASNGEEAIALAQQHSGQIHLLLTDVVLPGINGKEISERLKALLPNLKVLLMSGYTADVIDLRGALDLGVEFLHKPFSPSELASKVREVLTGPIKPIVEG